MRRDRMTRLNDCDGTARASLCNAGEALVKRRTPELSLVHSLLDSWSGLGAIVVGMERHGFEVWLAKDRKGWRSTFLHRSHLMQPWVGQVLYWCPTLWRAV